MRSFFPENAVEYFVSYYDYYQPEAYVPRTDTYVEKESSLNEQIDRMRHSATRAILERRDVIVVASVSCIYGIGSVETYSQMTEALEVGNRVNRNRLLSKLVELQYRRNDHSFFRGSFRVRGDTIELFPAHYEDRAWRISLFGDEIEAIHEIDPLTGEKTAALNSVKVYANSHYVTPRPTLLQAIDQIKRDLRIRLDEFHAEGKLLEAQRLEQRTTYDLEMIEATGSCAGIENYSRYLTGRSNSCRAMRWCSLTRAMSRCRSWAACSAATGRARRAWPSTASACRHAPTTGRSNSRNGTPIAARPSSSRRRRAAGRWSAPAASSSSRSYGRPGSSTRPPSSARSNSRSTT